MQATSTEQFLEVKAELAMSSPIPTSEIIMGENRKDSPVVCAADRRDTTCTS